MGLKDWISKGQSPDATIGDAHPLASELGLRRLQQSLSASQPAALLDQLGDALESGFDAGLAAAALRRALRILDGLARKPIAELQLAMLRDAKEGQIPEIQAAAVAKYCRRLGALIERALLDAAAAEAEAQAAGSDALLAVRGMRAWVTRKKLLRMVYRFPDEELWRDGNRLYAIAAQRDLLGTEIEAYAGEGHVSVLRERLVGLLFDVAPTASITPVQMECLDLLLRQYAASFIERAAPAAEVPFYVDLARPQPPQRWLPGLPARGSMRFFGLGAAAGKVGHLAGEKPVAGELIPAWAESSRCTAPAYRLLLAMLGRHWSDKPPQRRDRRSAVSSNVFLVHGFEDARRAVMASEEAIRVDIGGAPEVRGGDLMRDDKYFERVRFGSVNPDKTTTGKLLRKQLIMPRQILEKRERAEGRPLPESTAVADTSESGIGVALPGRAPWARVGVLVGYRSPDSLQWEVAIVRRLIRGARLSLGLERLRAPTLTARLMHVQGSAAVGIGAQEAILLDAPLQQLILPVGGCAEGSAFTVITESGQFALAVGKILEQTGDYMRVSFVRTGAPA